MNLQPSDYSSDVQRNLDQMGLPTALTANERDIVNDYERQDFGAKECAMHFSKQRI